MSSFFIKGKPKQTKKRKHPPKNNNTKKSQPIVQKPTDDDEEIPSDDEEIDAADTGASKQINFDQGSDEDERTPQDKRLKLAKLYLEEIEKEEKSRREDTIDHHESVSKRLQDDYLDSVGKLRKRVADDYIGVDEANISHLKHKLQNFPITCICLSADDNYLFVGSKTQHVIKFEWKMCKPIGIIDCAKAGESGNGKKARLQINSLALSSDFKYLAIAGMNSNIQIWCPVRLVHLHTLKGHRDIVTGLVIRKDTHQLYSTSHDRSVKSWSIDEMAYIETLFGHHSPITGIDALARDRIITSGGSDCTIRIWKITEESQLIYNGHRGSIESVKIINDEHFLSSGDDGSLCLWSALKKKPLYIVPYSHGKSANGEANWISSIATLINTNLVASGSCDGFIRIWKVGDSFRSLDMIFEFNVKGFVNGLQFNGDGTILVAAIGQEHRLGRWWRIKKAKNNVLIIPLIKKK